MIMSDLSEKYLEMSITAQLKLIVQVCKQAWGQTQMSVATFLTDRLRVPWVSAHLSTLTCSQTIQGRKYPQCIPQPHMGAFNSSTKAKLKHSASINWTSWWCPSSVWRHALQISCWRAKRQQSVTKWMVLRERNVTFEMLNRCHVKVAAPSMKTTFACFFGVSNPSELTW